jgi:hypothetical protein
LHLTVTRHANGTSSATSPHSSFVARAISSSTVTRVDASMPQLRPVRTTSSCHQRVHATAMVCRLMECSQDRAATIGFSAFSATSCKRERVSLARDLSRMLIRWREVRASLTRLACKRSRLREPRSCKRPRRASKIHDLRQWIEMRMKFWV